MSGSLYICMALYIIIQINVLWRKISVNTGKQKEKKRSHQEVYYLEIIMVKILGYFLLDSSRW